MVLRLKTIVLTVLIGFQATSVYADKPSLNVIAFKVAYDTQAQSFQALGHLSATQSAIISAPVSEIIEKIHISDGQQVKQHQLLFEFNNRQEKALLAEAKVAVQEAKRQYQRVKDLKDTSAVTQAQIDEKYSLWQIAVAQQKIIEVMLIDRKILAPFNGQLGFMDLAEGNLIEIGTPLVSLDNAKKMKLDILIPERFLQIIQVNQIIDIQSQAYPNQLFKGLIKAISPQLEANTRMIKVRAEVENSDLKLKTNMMVKALIQLADKQSLVVPNSAVLMLGDHSFVYRLKPQDTNRFLVEKVEVKTGEISEKTTEILSGLKDEDIIVSQGVLRTKPNKIVEIKAFENNLKQDQLLKPINNSLHSKQETH